MVANICMVGSWHQAMVYGAGLADLGHRVCGVCESTAIVEQLNAGRPMVYEPGLAELMGVNIRRGRLRYTGDYAKGLAGAGFVFIAIDTPVGGDDRADLTSVRQAACAIGRARTREVILCVTAQVPVGTCSELAKLVQASRPELKVDVAYVPEFLRLGTALETFQQADRVVVGADDPRIAKRVCALYKPLRRPILVTDLRTAEMAKHASNTFLATSISFINEISNLCEEVGADAGMVATILKHDRRIGPHAFLSPGLGYAGGTLGRELRALQEIGNSVGVATPLLDAVWTVNAGRASRIVARVKTELGNLPGKRIAVFGLTYKPGTSTLRRAISLDIIRRFVEEGATVRAFDPLADVGDVENLPPFERCTSPYEAATDADMVLLLTEWTGFDKLAFPRLGRLMRTPLFIDTRNIVDSSRLKRAGLKWLRVGQAAGPSAKRRQEARQ